MQDGSLSLAVDRVEESVGTLTGIAQNLGGRVDDVQYFNTEEADKKTAVITLRVPAVNFDAAMTQAKKIALKVQSEEISTRDVTEQFIDMQARLKNLSDTDKRRSAWLTYQISPTYIQHPADRRPALRFPGREYCTLSTIHRPTKEDRN